MLPVSVLPVAGILLGVGSANFAWLPPVVSNVMAQAGGAIFGNLPLHLRHRRGPRASPATTASLRWRPWSASLSWSATMGVMAPLRRLSSREPIMGIPSDRDRRVRRHPRSAPSRRSLFNRFYRVQLPPYLGFFAGKRSVPILTALAAIVAGIALSLVWPPIGRASIASRTGPRTENPALAFAIYGVVERSLIPFGLHHIWNVPVLLRGRPIRRPRRPARSSAARSTASSAGDPTAGNLAGGYLFKMWGLPAAALAMWRTARPENRAKVGGIMMSAALTSFLTGITEPIEFAFLFVAPLLYALHALLAGLAYFTARSSWASVTAPRSRTA